MSSHNKRPKGWLAEQIKQAQEDMKTWPKWMQRAARWEGGLATNKKRK